MKISHRLKKLSDLIATYKQGDIVADIGTDHAYLPCFLIQNDIVKHVYACDVAKGPYQSSKETIHKYGLEKQITALQGDGLEPILHKHVDMLVLAGMGSYLITEILNRHSNYVDSIRTMFFQANANTDHLRSYIANKNWHIVDEQMVKDSGHIYEIIIVTKYKTKVYTQDDILFGPILRSNKDPLFIEKWKKQHALYTNIMQSMSASQPRFQELQDIVQRIEGVLHES